MTIKVIAALLIAMLVSCEVEAAEDGLFQMSEAMVVTAHALDIASTQRCLGAQTCREMNPYLARFDNPLTFTTAKMSVGILGLWATRNLHKSHPKLAKVVNFAVAGTFMTIAAHNYRIGTIGQRPN